MAARTRLATFAVPVAAYGLAGGPQTQPRGLLPVLTRLSVIGIPTAAYGLGTERLIAVQTRIALQRGRSAGADLGLLAGRAGAVDTALRAALSVGRTTASSLRLAAFSPVVPSNVNRYRVQRPERTHRR